MCCTVCTQHNAAAPQGSPLEDFTKITIANAARLHSKYLVTVGVWLKRPLNFDANVVGLLL